MSTVTAPTTVSRRTGAADRRPGLGRLTGIELRKAVDTRSGLWLLIALAGLTLAVVVLSCVTGEADGRTFANVLSDALQPSTVLLPVVGILLVCTEWSQRTALVTFALVPQRGRVLAAKVLASIVLSLAALVLCALLAAAGAALASSGQDTWSLPGGLLAQDALSVVVGTLVGVAFGAALLAPAPAIVLWFALPLAVLALGSIHALEDVATWLDVNRASAPLSEHLLSGREWGRLATASLLWLVLPFAIGVARFRRAEIR